MIALCNPVRPLPIAKKKESPGGLCLRGGYIGSVLFPDLCHEVVVARLEVLHEDAEHELDHLAVECLIDIRQTDVEVDDAVVAQIIFENLVLRIELIEVVLEARPLVRRDARDDLRADDGEDARVDKDGHRQDLSLDLDARAEHDSLVVILERLRAEHVDVVVHEELLEVERLRVALDALLCAAGGTARWLGLFLLFFVFFPSRFCLRLCGLGFLHRSGGQFFLRLWHVKTPYSLILIDSDKSRGVAIADVLDEPRELLFVVRVLAALDETADEVAEDAAVVLMARE